MLRFQFTRWTIYQLLHNKLFRILVAYNRIVIPQFPRGWILSWEAPPAAVSVGLGCAHLKTQLRVDQLLSSLSWLLEGRSCLQAVGFRASIYCWLLARRHLLFHAMWVSLQGSACQASGFPGMSQLWELESAARQKLVLCHLIAFVRTQSLVRVNTRRQWSLEANLDRRLSPTLFHGHSCSVFSFYRHKHE